MPSKYVECTAHCQRHHASYLDGSRLAVVKRIIDRGQYKHAQKIIFHQVGKCNRKVWGVRHKLDVPFNFEKEMQEVKDLRKGCRKDVQNTRFVDAVEELQDAINRAKQNTDNKIRQRSLMTFAPLCKGFF